MYLLIKCGSAKTLVWFMWSYLMIPVIGLIFLHAGDEILHGKETVTILVVIVEGTSSSDAS